MCAVKRSQTSGEKRIKGSPPLCLLALTVTMGAGCFGWLRNTSPTGDALATLVCTAPCGVGAVVMGVDVEACTASNWASGDCDRACRVGREMCGTAQSLAAHPDGGALLSLPTQ